MLSVITATLAFAATSRAGSEHAETTAAGAHPIEEHADSPDFWYLGFGLGFGGTGTKGPARNGDGYFGVRGELHFMNAVHPDLHFGLKATYQSLESIEFALWGEPPASKSLHLATVAMAMMLPPDGGGTYLAMAVGATQIIEFEKAPKQKGNIGLAFSASIGHDGSRSTRPALVFDYHQFDGWYILQLGVDIYFDFIP